MSPNEFIHSNYEQLDISSKNVMKYKPHLANDLLQETVLIFLSKPNVQEIVDTGAAMYYIIRIMMNQGRSRTSPFYKKYINQQRSTYEKYIENLDEESYIMISQEVKEVEEPIEDEHYNLDIDLYAKRVQEIVSTLEWYENELFRLHYIEHESISKIARETTIPRASISMTLKRIRTHIIEKLKETYNDSNI